MPTLQNTLSFPDWIKHIEETISQSILECRPRPWKEDFISETWIRAFMAASNAVTVDCGPYPPFLTRWDAYKADGHLEEGHGDIAFLVKCTFRSGKSATGAAFLEAKRIYEGGSYNALERSSRW